MQLAHRFQGEVINCDSMQVYRGFDIGTDKLSFQAREGIPHHLLDMVDPEIQFTAADFARAASTAARKITARGGLPLVTGGTGLYLKALIHGLFPEGRKDDRIRLQLNGEAQRLGIHAMWEQLEEVDPAYAQKIGPRDGMRILRALEVYRATGRPISEHFLHTRSLVADFHVIKLGLELERAELYARINQRVDRMFAAGIIEETQRILASGVDEEAPPFRALGYQQVLGLLRGKLTPEEAIELTKRETRHYAKRQMTWFRKMPGILWFSPSDLEGLSEHLTQQLKS